MTDRESLVLCSYYLDNPALRRFDAIIRPEQFQEPGTSMLFTVLQKYHRSTGACPPTRKPRWKCVIIAAQTARGRLCPRITGTLRGRACSRRSRAALVGTAGQ